MIEDATISLPMNASVEMILGGDDLHASNIYSDDIITISNCDVTETVILAEPDAVMDKKHRDKMRKRALRQTADYKRKETMRSKMRMKMKRSDPIYRELERQRDRERRRVARMNNPEQRAVEKERDRQYKKRVRQTALAIENSVAEEVILPLNMSESVPHILDSLQSDSENSLGSLQPEGIISIPILNIDDISSKNS